MAEKALRAEDIFFDTMQNCNEAILAVRLTRPLIAGDEDTRTVSFHLAPKELDKLIIMMGNCVTTKDALRHAKAAGHILWTPT